MKSTFFSSILLLLYSSGYSFAQSGTCSSPAGISDSAPECAKKCARIKVQEGYCSSETTFNDAYSQCMSDNCNAQDKSAGLKYSYNDICPAACKGAAPTSTTSSSPPAATGTCDSPAGVPDNAPACVKKCASIKVKEGYCTSETTFNDAYKQCMSDNCNAQDKSTGLTYSYNDICPAPCRGASPTSTTSSSPPAATGTCDSPAGVPDNAPACVKKCASIKVKEGYCSSEPTFNDAYSQCMSDNCTAQDKSTGLTYSYNDICPAPCKGAAPTSTTSSSPPAATGTCDSPAGVPDTAPACVKKCASIKVKEGYCTSETTFNDAYKQCMSDNCNAQDKSTGLTYSYNDICPASCKGGAPTSTTSSSPPAATGTCDSPAGVPDNAPACVKKCASIKVKEGYCSSEPTFNDAYKQCMSDNCNAQDQSTGSTYSYNDICPANCKGDAPPSSTTSSNPPAATSSCESPAGVPDSAPACVKKCASIKVKEGYCSSEPTFNDAYNQCMTDNCNAQDKAAGLQYKYNDICPASCKGDPAPSSSSAAPTSTASSDPSPTSTSSSNPPEATGTCASPAGIPPSATDCVKKCAQIKVKEGYCSNEDTFNDAYAQCMSDNCNAQDKSTGLEYKYDDICPSDCKTDPTASSSSAAPTSTASSDPSSTITSAEPTSTTSSNPPPTSTASADPEVPTRTCETPTLIPDDAPECAKRCAKRKVQEGYCETDSLFSEAYEQCLDDNLNCNPQDKEEGLKFKYDDICPASCKSGFTAPSTSATPTPMTSSGPAPTATTSSSSPAATATCNPSSKVPATAPACVKKCATIKIREGYCTDENVFNQAYQQCLKDNCDGKDLSTGLQYKFDDLCPAPCKSGAGSTTTSPSPSTTASSDAPSPTPTCAARISADSPACVSKCATIKVQEGYCSTQDIFNKAYDQCIRDNCKEPDTSKGLQYKWDDICPAECKSAPPTSGVPPSQTGITMSPTTSSAGPSPTGDTGSGSGNLPDNAPSCARKCANIKVTEGYCYSSQVMMTAFYQCLSDNCNPNDAAKGRQVTYRQICASTGPNPTSSSSGPFPTGEGSGSGMLPANTPSCARKCASIKVREGYCSSSQVLLSSFYQCLSDNCNTNDAAKGRQLTYRQICGSTGPSPSSSSPGPSPTGDAGSGSGVLPTNTPSCVKKCATIKVREGYCSSSQVLMTAFYQCLSDNCNSNDAAKGRQLTYRQICGSTGPSPSSSSSGPSPTGDAGSGSLPNNTPSCVTKCATIKVREGYCSSSRVLMTSFFQCLSDNCKSDDVAKGRTLTYGQICGSSAGGGGTPNTSATRPLPTGKPDSGSAILNKVPACVRKCAQVKVSEGYCYSPEAFTIAYHRCLRDNCDRDIVREGLKLGYSEICPLSNPGTPTTSSASPKPTSGSNPSIAALKKAPACVKKCAQVKVSEGYCYSAPVFTVSYHRCLRDNCDRDTVREGLKFGFNEICSSNQPTQPPTGGSSNTTKPGASSGQIPSTAPQCVRNCAQIKIKEGYCSSPTIFSSSYLQCLMDNCNAENLAVGRAFTYTQICGSSGTTGGTVQPTNPPTTTPPTGPPGNKTGTGNVPSTAPRCVMNCARIKVQEGYCVSPTTFTKAFSQCLRSNCNQADANEGAKLTHKQICGPNDGSDPGKAPCNCTNTVAARSIRHAPRDFVL